MFVVVSMFSALAAFAYEKALRLVHIRFASVSD